VEIVGSAFGISARHPNLLLSPQNRQGTTSLGKITLCAQAR
jgi:hypothetical protein